MTFQYGKAFPATDRNDQGRVAVFGSNGIVGFCETALAEEPAIIIGRKGSAGALNLCNGPSWTTDVAYFLISPVFFDIRFLYIALQVLDLGSLGKGVKPGLSRSEAYQLPIVIPPLAEQHRIVAKVDELMALCDHLQAEHNKREARRDLLVASSLNRISTTTAEEAKNATRFHLNHLPRLTTRTEHIKQLRQTILNLAVRGRLVPQDSNDEPAAELLKRIQVEKARLGVTQRRYGATKGKKGVDFLCGVAALRGIEFDLPSWEWVMLNNLSKLVTSGSRGWAEFYSDTGPKFIRAQNIRFGKLHINNLACVDPPQNTEGARTLVSKGDLLIVITGAGVTNPALLDEDLGETYVSQHVALIKPTKTDLSRWLLLCLMAPDGGRSELVECAYGSGKPGLNLDNIRLLKIPLPPLAEQHRIVAKVDELMALCDQLETQLTTTEADSRRLLEAVLRDALNPVIKEAA